MGRKIAQYFVVVSLMSTLLTGCYMALQETDMAQQAMVIDLQSQEVLGYAGDGDYIRAKVYDADEATSMVDSSIITINDYGGGYGDLTYQPENLLTPLHVQSFFLGTSPLPSGLVILVALPPRRYRILVEYINVWEGGSGFDIYNANLTDAIEVKEGQNTSLSISMFNYSYS